MKPTTAMTPEIALRTLDLATHPANAGKLTRNDYANCEQALHVLAGFVADKSKEAETARSAAEKTQASSESTPH